MPHSNLEIAKWGARHRHSDPVVSPCCRIISCGLKPTNLDSVHLLAGIAPHHIWRSVACRMERIRQTTDARHQLSHHQTGASRLKSRKSFMRTVTPLDSSASSSRLRLWKDSLTDLPAYLYDTQSLDCDCGEPQTMAHLLSCRLQDEACTDDDLATVTERAKAYAPASGRKVYEGPDRIRSSA